MKLNDKLISSLDSLRINFDFIEIWNKRGVAIRDLSPSLIYYPNNDMVALYEAFAHPEKVIKDKDNGNLFIHKDEGDVPLSLDIGNEFLQSFPFEDQIQISAIHKLANIEISEQIALEINLTGAQVILNNGQALNVAAIEYDPPYDPPLVHKAIIVPSTSKRRSRVGNYYIAPGEMTYGIFCGNKLVEVAPPYARNSSFCLEYRMYGHTICLEVTNVETNRIEAIYRDSHFYSLLGDDDFILIDGLYVRCFTNRDLNNRLQHNVTSEHTPQIVSFDEDQSIITVTYDDGTTIQLDK